MPRTDGRQNSELRPIRFDKSPQKDPAGSCLISWGETKVICSASIEEKVPKWMTDKSTGWITAEYCMLPGSSDRRIHRDRARNTGRTHEIQRLIGRSLRSSVNLKKMGPRTMILDCDVIQADGGTRVASITGSYIAMRMAFHKLLSEGLIPATPPLLQVAAISVGKVNGEIFVDLNFPEDSSAEVDANIVMNERGEFVELQSTAEKGSFSKDEWSELLDSGVKACEEIFQIQNRILKEWEIEA